MVNIEIVLEIDRDMYLCSKSFQTAGMLLDLFTFKLPFQVVFASGKEPTPIQEM